MGTHYQGTEAEVRALDTYIKLSRAAEAVTTTINDHLKNYRLTISQFGVLESLYHLGPLHQHVLAEKILKSTGNMTMVIDNLVKRKLVERRQDETDRRYNKVYLLEAGQLLMEEIFPRHVNFVVESMQVLSAEEQAILGTLCRKLGLGQRP